MSPKKSPLSKNHQVCLKGRDGRRVASTLFCIGSGIGRKPRLVRIGLQTTFVKGGVFRRLSQQCRH